MTRTPEMVDPQVLRTHLRFSLWATEQILSAASNLTEEEQQRDFGISYSSVIGTLKHIYQADRVWLRRIHGESPTSLDDADEPQTLADLAPMWTALLARWSEWADALDAEGIARVVDYRSLKGDPYRSPVWQIVLHVVNHATYHRGQASALLRQLGTTPPAIDLIVYYRLNG